MRNKDFLLLCSTHNCKNQVFAFEHRNNEKQQNQFSHHDCKECKFNKTNKNGYCEDCVLKIYNSLLRDLDISQIKRTRQYIHECC